MINRSRKIIILIFGVLFMILIGCGQQVNKDNVEEEFLIDKAVFESSLNNIRNSEVGDNGVKIINDTATIEEFGIPKHIIAKYGIKRLFIEKDVDTDYFKVCFVTVFETSQTVYFYYSSNGLPDVNEEQVEYDETSMKYYEKRVDREITTWPICENWFYYECFYTRGSVF